jgi:hypothetical protein
MASGAVRERRRKRIPANSPSAPSPQSTATNHLRRTIIVLILRPLGSGPGASAAPYVPAGRPGAPCGEKGKTRIAPGQIVLPQLPTRPRRQTLPRPLHATHHRQRSPARQVQSRVMIALCVPRSGHGICPPLAPRRMLQINIAFPRIWREPLVLYGRIKSGPRCEPGGTTSTPSAARCPLPTAFPLADNFAQLDNYVAKNRNPRQNSTRHNDHATKPATKPYDDRHRRKSCVNKRILQSRTAQLTPRGQLCRQKCTSATKLAATVLVAKRPVMSPKM